MFEVLVGKTPFEEDDVEEMYNEEELYIYYERSRLGKWIGTWQDFVPKGVSSVSVHFSPTLADVRNVLDLEHLLRSMICPDPAYRITAMQAYHHPALQPKAPSVIITPHFVRAAASFELEEPVPEVVVKDKKAIKRKAKKREAGHAREGQHPGRAATPALGESIKQHTSAPRPKGEKARDSAETRDMSPSLGKKIVLRKSREALLVSPKKDTEQDPTRKSTSSSDTLGLISLAATRKSKPAQPLRVKQLSYHGSFLVFGSPNIHLILIVDDVAAVRTSDSQSIDLARSASPAGVTSSHSSTVASSHDSASTAKIAAPATTAPTLSHYDSRRTLRSRDSNLSLATSTSTAVYTKEEAVLKAMRSLEGVRKPKDKSSNKDKRNVLGAITRPAPSPPRPRSLDSQIEVAESKRKDEQRRSLGVDRTLMDVVEESPIKATFDLEASKSLFS